MAKNSPGPSAEPSTIPLRPGEQSFLGAPVCADPARLDADVAILGIPYGAPYPGDETPNDQSNAPSAVRAQSHQFSDGADHWDFDLGGTLLDGRSARIADCGDAAAGPMDGPAHYRNAQAAVRQIVARGALPIVIGGDHGVTIPALGGFEGHDPITLVHVDAHIDWRDEVGGVRDGYSSPIRRASEMAHIGRIFQIGMRGQGSARAEEARDARDYGARIATATVVHDCGMAAILEEIPAGERTYLTIDADGLDPAVMPAVAAPVPGGLTFHQVRALIHGLVAKGRVVGMDVVEITPARDLNHISSITAGRLILNLIGAAARAGYFDQRN